MAGKTTRVVMPQLGESVHEGTISKWLVKPGDKVVDGDGAAVSPKVESQAPSPPRGEGRGEGGAQKTETQPAPPAPSEPPPRERGGDEPHRFSPGVQMAASDLKVDLSKVTGTGLGGRVTKKDVEEYAAKATAAPSAPPPPAPVQPGEGDQVVQLTRVRRLIAENMTRSKQTIPHAWQTQEADMSGVVANRNANKAAFQKQEGFSLTYLPYVMAATISALREHPEVNSTFNETELLVHRNVNLGISVGLEDTLLVPVVRNADSLSIAGLARAVNDLATRARNKQLKADDLTGGTFTVNNSGTFGTLFSYSVINPGQAGILTMEAIVERPMAIQGMIGIKPMMYLCFSFDHRVLDGLQAARFLTSCRKWLEAVTMESPVY
ncbi:MAG: hypothetical protein AUI15_19320 [Actinobacteria bacterium 13_2_20CM_2_66_6]|nr:MAG: hypothetical protein AUI15_19320 [Actinobacteria bacterium 13_2_20CM_2_66_6]